MHAKVLPLRPLALKCLLIESSRNWDCAVPEAHITPRPQPVLHTPNHKKLTG